jgi:non-ribosomal peptide synthetase component F
MIITSRSLLNKLLETDTSINVLIIDDVLDSESKVENAIIPLRYKKIIDTDPYCIINTSGSTGTPKGVVLNHRSFVDFVEWAVLEMNFKERELMGSLSPLVFDIYSFELCMLMMHGHALYVIPETLAAFPIKMVEYLFDQNISFLFWVPALVSS